MAYSATGHVGAIHAGYAVAATLTDWRLDTIETCGPVRSTVSARVVRADTCLMTLGRLTRLRLEMAPGVEWSWPITRCSRDDDTITVEVPGRPAIRRTNT